MSQPVHHEADARGPAALASDSGNSLTPEGQALLKARQRPRHEYAVRAHTVYSVTDFTQAYDCITGQDSHDPRDRKVETLVEGLPLEKAVEIATQCAAVNSGSKLRLMQTDTRQIDAAEPKSEKSNQCAETESLAAARGLLVSYPHGSTLTYRLESTGAGLVLRRDLNRIVDVTTPEPVYSIGPSHIWEEPPQPPAWDLAVMTAEEIKGASVALRDLPHAVAVSLRRNATAAKDGSMVALLNRAGVAMSAA